MNEFATRSVNAPEGTKQTSSYLTVRQQEGILFRWWYSIASPIVPGDHASFKEKEHFRRGRTGSQLIPFLYILLIVSLPAAFSGANPFLLIIIFGGLLALTLATVLNRIGKIEMAAFIVVATTVAYPTVDILTTPGGLSMLTLPLFGLLVLPLVCAVSFLPEWWVFIIALVNGCFTLYALTYASQTAELNAVLQIDFAGIITPIILIQIIVSVVAYLWVFSTRQALERADRAEEIAKLEHDLALQSDTVARQKQQLDRSIYKIVEAHTRVANGEFSARVPLTDDNVLWQISGSLNNLLARLQRLRQEVAELQHVKLALQQAHEENRQLAKKLAEVSS